jgi:hypothetical protein
MKFERGVHRRDVGSLRPKKKMADGRLRCDAYIARSGVLEYRLPNGKIQREFVPEEELFDPNSMETIKGAILTEDHPAIGLVDSKTARDLQRGIVGENIRRDGVHLAGTIYVTDAELIEKMESRQKIDVSPGYTCDIEWKSGKDPKTGERYDCIQRNRRYNHTAIVEFGRAGSARVRMDAAQQLVHQEKNMGKPQKKDDKERDQALLSTASKISSLETKLTEAEARADAAEGRVAALETEVERLRKPDPDADKLEEVTAELEKEKRRADVAERGLATMERRIRDGVKRRVDLERSAREALGEEDSRGQPIRLDDLTDREIMAVVVERIEGKSIETERSDDYARARFDAAIEGFRAGSAALDRVREEASRSDVTVRTDAASVRERYYQDKRDAWQKPLPSSAMKKGA